MNGDFTGGLIGWNVYAFDRSSSPMDPSRFITVTQIGGSPQPSHSSSPGHPIAETHGFRPGPNTEPKVKFDTGNYSDGLGEAGISQGFTVTAATSFLRFDFTLPTAFVDSTGTGSSVERDLFSATIMPNADLMFVGRDGTITTGPSHLRITVLESPIPGFDKRLTAALSSLLGTSVMLNFTISQVDDGFRLDTYLDNVALSAIPEPAESCLAIGFGCVLLLLYRKAGWFR